MFKRLLFTMMLALGFTGLLTQGVPAQKQTPEEKMAKARMERKIRKEILSLPYYGVFDVIGYELKKETVGLNGYVIRPLTKKDAEEAIKEIEGVQKVINDIKVLPPSPSDDRLRVRIYRAIANQGGLYRYLLGSTPSIRIIVKGGRVTLEGIVTYNSDRILAEVAATEIFGVLSVKNNLVIEKREGEKIG